MITVVACADKEPQIDYLNRGFKAFTASCRKFGHEPLLLGWGQPWRGLGNKPKLLKQAIESGQIKTEFMLFCDAFDVILLDSPAAIHAILGDRFVWNAEKNCFPEAGMACDFEQVPSPYKFLNSGVCHAPTDIMLEALTEMKADEIPDDHWDGKRRVEPNDQWYWQMQFLHGSVPMELDHGCKVFQTLHAVEDTEVTYSRGVALNSVMWTNPVVLHANGDKNHPAILAAQQDL